MKTLLICEFIKIRRTSIPWILFLAPVVYGLLLFLVIVQGGRRFLEPDAEPWVVLQTQFWPLLLMLFAPIFMALVISVSHNLDTKNDMWKVYYTLPINKTTTYITKSLFNLLLIFLLFVLVSFIMPVIGISINVLTDLPSFSNFDDAFFKMVLPDMLRSFGGAVLLWALHNWISYRFENFIVSVSIALMGSVVTLFAVQGWEHSINYPYAFPYLSLMEGNETFSPAVVKSLIGGAIIFALSVIDMKYFNKGK